MREKLTNTEIIEIWKKIIDVQKHFNDICIRLRALSITVITAFIGAIGYLWGNSKIDVDTILLLTPLVVLAWTAFYLMDMGWYQRLLIGAVQKGKEIEKNNKRYIPEIALATQITIASEESIFGKFAEVKLHAFYLLGYFILLLPLYVY